MIYRIFTIIKRDVKSGFRDAIILYILLSPILVALLLRAFIPSVNSATLQLATLENSMMIEHLEQYGSVETFDSIGSLQKRVNATDDIVGIIAGDSSSYEIILEGNESAGTVDTVESLLLAYEGYGELPVTAVVSDIGWEISSIASIGAVSLILLATLLGGMISGMNIVEERQMRTINAIRVSPANTMEFLIAKCSLGIIIPIIQAILTFWILGLTDINWGMAVVISIFSSLIGLIVGVLLGVINDDPLAAAGGLKIMMLPMSATIVGALLLPPKLLPLLYWCPYYWTYAGVTEIIYKTATWTNIMMYCGAIVAITVVVFALLRKRIKAGLSA